MKPKILVVDGYASEARAELVAGGARMASDLYVEMLEKCWPGARCDVLFPSDTDEPIHERIDLGALDAVAWTGCSLTIYDDDPRVHRMLALAKAAYAAGVPSFGSCWGAQVAVVAAGGRVAKNPNGREMGLARKIQLTDEGRGHPFYAGKPSVFEGFISHEDEITHLPPGAVCLAANHFTRVQAVAVTHGPGSFWALQYHPEYDVHELARLTFCRIDKLIKKGFFVDRTAALDYVDKLETLHQEPGRTDLGWLLAIDADVQNEDIRLREVRNWLEYLVLPTMMRRR